MRWDLWIVYRIYVLVVVLAVEATRIERRGTWNGFQKVGEDMKKCEEDGFIVCGPLLKDS